MYADVLVSESVDELIFGYDWLALNNCQWLFAKGRILVNGLSFMHLCLMNIGGTDQTIGVGHQLGDASPVDDADVHEILNGNPGSQSLDPVSLEVLQSPQGTTSGNVEALEVMVSTPEDVSIPVNEQSLQSPDPDSTLLNTSDSLGEITPSISMPSDLPSVVEPSGVSEVDHNQMLRRIIDSVADATLLDAAITGVNGSASTVDNCSPAMVDGHGVSHLGDTNIGDANCPLSRSVAPSDHVNNDHIQTPASDGPICNSNTASIDDEYYSHLRPMIDKLPEDLSAEQVAQVTDLLLRNADIFSRSQFDCGCTDVLTATVPTMTEQPIAEPLHRHARVHLNVIDKQISEMQAAGIVEPACSPWSANLVMVAKKLEDGKPTAPRVTSTSAN